MPARIRLFRLPEGTDLCALEETLRTTFGRVRRDAHPTAYRYADTFDARLYRSGTVLLLEETDAGGTLWIEQRRPPRRLRSLPMRRLPERPQDLPPGPFREALAERIAPRLLGPVLTLRFDGLTLAFLNRDEKTVARLLLATNVRGHAPDGSTATLPPVAILYPVRGFRRAARRLARFLTEHLGAGPLDAHPFDLAVETLGLDPAARAHRPEVTLDPDERADRAIRRLLLPLLETMILNEPGLRDGRDPEFLHDYRVALRRTRTLLGHLKNLFPPDPLAHFRSAFKWLGALTGPVRDLDVYLLQMEAYRMALPEAVRTDLAPLEAFLRRERQAAHAALVAALDTPRYRRLLAAWRSFLEADPPEPPPTPEAHRPIRTVASRHIRRAWRRLLRHGHAIRPQSPPDALHTLRIDAKKLRYLLESFHSLYPERPVRKLVNDLKRLQDTLGAYQDLAVQQEALQTFARRMAAEGAAPVETFTAIGRLEAHLADRQQHVRTAFTGAFEHFVRPKNRRRVERLFST